MRPTPNFIRKIEQGDGLYPARLNDLYDPPPYLYISGNSDFLRMPMVAIVGARNASCEGLKNAGLFAQSLARAGCIIVSGLAKGIDGAAHRATLDLGANHGTVAICGTGLNIAYPQEHFGLMQSISRQGLLISELSPEMGPKAFHFPRRNRIIAALCLGVIVIEAAERSGSLITARLASELGREVFALPGPINDPLYAGCHQLIQQGAKLVRGTKDVLEDLIFPKNPI